MNSPDILTPLQRQVMDALFADEWFRRYFYLTGGTALAAFHLFHRESDDLDFFCHGQDLTPVPALISAVGKKLAISVDSEQTRPGFMRFTLAKSLKVDFVRDVDFRVGVPESVGHYRIDSLKNIAVNKVCAILGRLDTKDYVDLYFILKDSQYDIDELLELGHQKDRGLEVFTWATVIGDVESLDILPRMIKPISFEELCRFYLALRDRLLDKIRP